MSNKPVKDTNVKTTEGLAHARSLEETKITLSTGVVVQCLKMPPLGAIMVMTSPSFRKPEPPVYYNEKMGREMENPDDPDYIARVNAREMEKNDNLLNLMIIFGTEIVSTPKGMEGPKGEKWVSRVKLTGIQTMPEDDDWRYLTWMKFVAATDEEDIKKIQEVVGRLSGIRNDDVKAAEDFPGSNEKDR